MRVVIVGRTKMSGTNRCIGGLLEDGSSVRLIKPNGQWDINCQFDVGDIWDIEFNRLQNLRPPHTEDVLVTSYEYVGKHSNVGKFIKSKVTPWKDGIVNIFDGKVAYTGNYNGYISENRGTPAYSTWFWTPDQDLTLRSDGTHYDYPQWVLRKGMKYVGEQAPVQAIPAGTLVRLSLARWWKPQDISDLEERCYLQLSGWY